MADLNLLDIFNFEMNRPTELTVEWFHTLPNDIER